MVLLTRPWPERLYAFSSVWATLAQHARLAATCSVSTPSE
jgi:hypothetical protein